MSSQNSLPTTSIFDFDFLAAGSKYFPPLQPGLLTLHTAEEFHYAMVLWYYEEGFHHAVLDQMLPLPPPSPSPSPTPLTVPASPRTWSTAFSFQVWVDDDDVWASEDNEECDMVLTSIESPPIQSLIDFPWTPTGVELPALNLECRNKIG